MQTLLLVHGGVSGAPLERHGDLATAVAAGSTEMPAIDAVERATIALEDDPELNAGTGAVLNRAGRIELDAGLCDGRSGRFGGVAGVRAKNPIRLARRVMEATPHSLMIGAGADELGDDIEEVEPTRAQTERWERARAGGLLNDEAFGHPESVDTVGAIALDPEGSLAAASSTGGVFGKLPGRVGDAAIHGAGFYASTRAAVVGTGVGELFLRWLAAFRVASLIEEGLDPQRACRDVIRAIAGTDPRTIGLLAVDAGGRTGAAYAGTAWDVAGPEGPIEPELVS